jgi:hypothetical protein
MPSIYNRVLIGILIAIASSGLLWAAIRIWWNIAGKRYLTRYSVVATPQTKRLHLGFGVSALFHATAIQNAARALRAREESEVMEISVTNTIHRTIQNGGHFTPVYAHRSVAPEYLALVDRASAHDQLSEWVTRLLDALEESHVILTRYYFDVDARTCIPHSKYSRPVSLQDLAARFSYCRLLVFSDASGLLDKLTGGLAEWSKDFLAWKRRVLILPPGDFLNATSRRALRTIFPIGDLSPDGLISAVEPYAYPSDASERIASDTILVTLYNDRQSWISRAPIDRLRIEQTDLSLQRFLGPAGFFLLCACAVYPELSMDTTLFLATFLRTKDRIALLDACDIRKLLALPWFRHSYMPDWLRVYLIYKMQRSERKMVRDAVSALLLSSLAPGRKAISFEFARQHSWSLVSVARAVLRLLRHDRTISAKRNASDHVFVGFLLPLGQLRLSFELPARLRPAIDIRAPHRTLAPHLATALETSIAALTAGLWGGTALSLAQILAPAWVGHRSWVKYILVFVWGEIATLALQVAMIAGRCSLPSVVPMAIGTALLCIGSAVNSVAELAAPLWTMVGLLGATAFLTCCTAALQGWASRHRVRDSFKYGPTARMIGRYRADPNYNGRVTMREAEPMFRPKR